MLRESGQILVSRRRSEDHLGGLWEFPGGKIEADETPERALVRELREELGIETRVDGRWGTLTHRYPEREVRLHFFFVRIESGQPEALEVADFRWVSPPELVALEFPDADRPLVEELLRCHREGQPLRTARPPKDEGE